MADYTNYLALNVLNNGQPVTYRLLSRALKVHANLAKQMLFDFHQKQNVKNPGKVHATYLLTGTQLVRNASSQTNGVHGHDGEDVHMRSSPIPSSSAPQPQDDEDGDVSSIKLVTLARQEDLEEVKTKFDELSSIHIYSLEPGPLRDLEVLTDCSRKITVEFATEDPLEMWKQYGVIQNANVKRRTGRRPPPPAPVAAPAKPALQPAKAKPSLAEPARSANTSATSSKIPTPEPEAAAAAPAKSTKATSKPAASKPPTVKRENSLFASFAKAKPKAAKPATQSSAENSAAQTPTEDEPMGGLSDEEAGDDDDAAMFDDNAIDAPAEKSSTRKSKTEREEELRRMMDDEDEPMADANNATEHENENEPTAAAPDPSQGTSTTRPSQAEPETEPEPEPESEAQPNPKPKPKSGPADPTSEQAEASVSVSNGRRRGRRRVMKKKTVKDEEGYLVTREEAAWESFSEDEPAPKKARIAVVGGVQAAGKAAGKKGGKAGQGNIMSFFAKKS